MLSAGNLDTGVPDACSGDSGGPLFVIRDGVDVQIGIVHKQVHTPTQRDRHTPAPAHTRTGTRPHPPKDTHRHTPTPTHTRTPTQDTMLCAGNFDTGVPDACSGDSGGPLFVTRGGVDVQIGIIRYVKREVSAFLVGALSVFSTAHTHTRVRTHIHTHGHAERNHNVAWRGDTKARCLVRFCAL